MTHNCGDSASVDKMSILKKMFSDISNEQLACLLHLLNGNVHKVVKVVSVCLEGVTTRKVQHEFRSAKMITRIKKVSVRSECITSRMHSASTSAQASM